MDLHGLIQTPFDDLAGERREAAFRYLQDPEELEIASAGWSEDELHDLLDWLGAIEVEGRGDLREAAAQHFGAIHRRVLELSGI